MSGRMTPDDPRHGTSAGYVAGCRTQCCRTAIADWTRHARTRRYLYGDLMVSSTGTRRRIQALVALGWSTRVLDGMLGKKRTYTAAVLVGGDAPLRRSTADMYAALYDRLSMQLPPLETRYQKQTSTRNRNYARQRGWLPPLAWLDIDDPDEQPDLTAVDDLPDLIVVERILAGDWRLKATPAERAEVAARWTGSVNQLERLTGWNLARDARRERSAA